MDLLPWRGSMPGLFNGFEHLLDDFRVQICAAMERNRDSQRPPPVYAMAALGTEQLEAGADQRAFRFDRCPPR